IFVINLRENSPALFLHFLKVHYHSVFSYPPVNFHDNFSRVPMRYTALRMTWKEMTIVDKELHAEANSLFLFQPLLILLLFLASNTKLTRGVSASLTQIPKQLPLFPSISIFPSRLELPSLFLCPLQSPLLKCSICHHILCRRRKPRSHIRED